MERRSQSERTRTRRRRLTAGALAAAVHALLLVLLLRDLSQPLQPEPPAIQVILAPPLVRPLLEPPVEPKPGGGARAQAAAPSPSPPKPSPPRAPRPKPPPDIPPRYAPQAEVEAPPAPAPRVSAAELAQATTAESEAGGAGAGGLGAGEGGGDGGAGGGRCDMVRRLQAKLQGHPSLQAAVMRAQEDRGFEPVLVWNGDWVRRGVEDGKGLAGLRQAIAVEVAFSPRRCRDQAMRGLVLLRLDERPGGPRIVLGTRAWRWSDLLFAR